MTMSKLRITPVDNKPRTFDYLGIKFQVVYTKTLNRMVSKRSEMMIAAGFESDADWLDMTEAEQGFWNGKAMIGTLVLGFEDFTVTTEDGEELKASFNAPSELDEFETQGEEVLCGDLDLQNDILVFCRTLANFKTNREAKAVGNSSKPSDSTETKPLDVTLDLSTTP